MKLIILNGPPRSGKDRIAYELQRALITLNIHAIQYKFAGPMKRALKAFFSLSDEEFQHYFESPAKDVVQERFLGKTPREVLISFSEAWVKPFFGKETFGLLAGQTLTHKKNKEYRLFADFVVITDCGFEEELDGLFKFIDPKNCVIYRLQRNGTDYRNDSRSWIMDERVLFNKTLDNNRDVVDVVEDILTDLGI